MSRLTRALAAIGSITLLAACSSPAASPATTPDPTTAEPTTAATTAATESPAAEACARENLELKNEGRLTIGTGNPAYPPYFEPPAEGEEPAAPANQPDDPWALGDPTNGQGFESAVAYAIADELGFSEDEVDWIAVAWEDSWAPGEKEFDFNLNQTSYRPERAEQVDMSEGYYFLNQSLVANAGTPIEDATTIEDLREYRLGAQIGTTSLAYIEDVIQPNEEPSVYNDNEAAIAALDAEQIDGIVVDLPTAFFITAAQMDNGVIVGQFPSADGEQEYFSVVLEQDSPLTDCVNEALANLKEDGTLEDITNEWLSDRADAPMIEN